MVAHAYASVDRQRAYLTARLGPADARAFLARMRLGSTSSVRAPGLPLGYSFVVFSLQEDLEAALAMANRASRLALRHFQSGVTWSSKRDGTPVTEADRAVEELLRQDLRERRPW